jgi:hypothetical protein
MKKPIFLKNLELFRVPCLVGVLVAHASASAGLIVTKGDGTGEVRITATNPSNTACGAQINLGDGKTDRRRLEAKEQWQLQHAFKADGNFTVNLSGVFITRGLRSVSACELQQSVVVTVSGGQAAVTSASSTAAAAPATPAAPAATAAPATAAGKTQSAPSPSPGETADLVLFSRKNSDNLQFVTSIDGTKKLDSVGRLVNSGFQLCFVLQPDAYRGLGGADAQLTLNNEVSSTINALAGNRQIRSKVVQCIRNGQFVGSFADVVAVQRRVVSDLKALREFAGFEEFAVVKYDSIAQAESRRQQAATQRSQDTVTWTAEINTLSETNSLDKVGSITLSAPRGERDSLKACTLEYSGMQGQAVNAYGNRLISFLSPAFRAQAFDLRATFDANKPYSSVYKSMDNFYIEHQKDPTKCNVFVDFPKNLKTLVTALERDRKGVPFDINALVSTVELREDWAKKQGYENLAASEFASQIQGSPSILKNLSVNGVKDKSSFDKTIEEMRAAKYSDENSVSAVLAYLEDKTAASQRSGSTATSIRREREAKAEQFAKAERARIAELERIRNLPLTRAELEPGKEYTRYSDNSCTESASQRCMTLSQYKQMCDFAEGITLRIRSTNAVMYSGDYAEFLRTGGTMEQVKYGWSASNQQCFVSFTISGTFKGSSHSKTFSGRASTFVANTTKRVLIHSAEIR